MNPATWHHCADSASLQEAKITEVCAIEKRICLLRLSGSLYAFSAMCPHSGANLCEGRTDSKGRVVCPLHGYRFNPANGHNTSGEGYKLKTYPVKEEEGCIFVQF